MTSKKKVGSWLERNENGHDESESSDVEGSSSGESSIAVAKTNGLVVSDDEEEEDEEVEDEEEEEEEVDWEALLPKLRAAVMDKSKKRRQEFFAKYLHVKADSPPAVQTPAVMSILLSCLPLLNLPEHIDMVVGVLLELVKRDEKLEDGAERQKLGDKLVKWVALEVDKATGTAKTAAPVGLMPYLLTIVGLLSTLNATRSSTSNFVESTQFQELVLALASVLDAIEAREAIGKETAKSSRFRHKVGVRVWRVLRQLRGALPHILKLLLSKTASPPYRYAPLIGHVIGVAIRLPSSAKPKDGGSAVTDARVVVEAEKDAILAFYMTNILSSKVAVPRYAFLSFSEFLSTFVTFDDLTTKFVPAAERMLLRSPENSLDVVAELVRSCPHDLSPILPSKLVPSVLSAAKSTNSDTRSKSIDLFRAVLSRCSDPSVQGKIAIEVLAGPKTGKSTSHENRAALFAMIGLVSPSDSASPSIVDTLVPLISKETNESALTALCSALAVHLADVLSSSSPLVSLTASALSKELNSTKPSTRRLVSDAVGNALWSIHLTKGQLSPNGEKIVSVIVPALEANLQTASANLPANPSGYLEGYVAIAIALGPLRTVESATKLNSSPALQGILATSPKPSFVINEKIWAKLPATVDLRWLLRALEGVVLQLGDKLTTASSRTAIGLGLIFVAFETQDSQLRREAFTSLSSLMQAQPKLTSRIVRDGLLSWFKTQDEERTKKAKRVTEDDEVVTTKSRDIGKLLSAVFTSKNTADKSLLEDIAVDYLVLAHHPELTEEAQTSWIGLLQAIGLDPATVARDKKERIFKILYSAAGTPAEDGRLAEAAYRAMTTLSFVCSAVFVDAFIEQIRSDLDPSALDFIGLEERGIWATPPDQLFVDVLSPKKEVVENKNRKDYATEKWEQEVRESLAKKPSAKVGGNLSKQDKAAVAAQMVKEAEIRQRIAIQQAKLRRGIEMVASLVASSADRVAKNVRLLAQLLLRSAFGLGSFLVDERAFQVFISLSSLAADRLGEDRRMLAAAILRSYDAPLVAEDYQDEPVGDLVTRLLHQIHFVAEQAPLDSTTFALTSLLLSRVVEIGGVGSESSSSEQAQEQLTLVVSIIAACCGEFLDDSYPRLETLKDLVRIMATYPRLAKDAASALADLGDAIKDVATPAEISEMIAGTLSKDSIVRNAALQALQPVDLTELDYSEELWIALHDEDEQNASLAAHIWEDNGLDVPETYLTGLLKYLAHESAAVRISTAGALADAAEHYPSQIAPTLSGLEDLYAEQAKELQPEYDRFGMIIPETLNRADPFESRVAIAFALEKLGPLLPQQLVASVVTFLVFKNALGDRNGQVRRAMLNAGIKIIDLHGAKDISPLMKTFEDYLGKGGKSSETEDYTKEAVVILFGRLAGHLDADDPRVPQVVDRLVEALHTPSELVQSAVADCLPALVQGMSDEVEYLVDKLFSTLTTGAKYASRRGAAYGLAGVIKGRGLQALKEYDLMERLQEAIEDKTSYQGRQGALFAFETLSATLGRAFEPYIISIIPLLLVSFGDSNTDVREATQDASKVIMSRVSGHCVKLMLPTLLGGLEEKQWRIKKGSIELLGAMAFCAPRQLSLSLPTIIPQLTGVINDSHAQVKAAANTSLKRFGEVLSNPEIKAMQSTLMKALADPSAKTNNALSVLLKTSFEHYLDAPSLALVMPIIDRGLRQRSSDIKRKSVQIVGNMASLTESRDLVPYLVELMPLVHDVLVDPVPEARATAAKSLGTLVERLGESNFPNLVNQLLQTLRSDTSGVDRQGAAQGLSEVLSGLGMERLEGLLPEVITNTASPRPYVREGFISLLVYLPATFGHRFAPHLGRVVPPILNGLADDSEFVREASMRAGKMIIANYSNKAVDLLLPELEKGMLDASWRIRQSSIALTGELLYKVTGISGKVELEEEEAPAHSADNARKALLDALGQEKRDRILATLYIVRQDAVGIVRQASIHIWKALVHNTPRTTREILPVLMQLIMSLLGSPEAEQQETASRTLGELCRKNGERIFGEIIPILQKAITAPDDRTKEGACLAFADVMAAINKDVIADHEDAIISSVRTALVDSSRSVRAAAARTFDTMQHYMGAKAVDQTIPTLLEAMRDPGETSETALQALKEVMSVRANSVFPVLIPTLIAQPITAFNARALGALVKVAGTALNRRLDTVLGALIKSLENEQSDEIRSEVQLAIESLVASVTDSDGVHLLEMLLIGWAKDVNPTRRATACNVFATMCQVNTADTSEYRIDWIRILVSLFDDSVEEVVTAAWEALEHFVKTVPKDELEDLVVPLRRTIESTGAPGRDVPGFSRPKGVQSLVPILLAGVLGGTQEQREQAALGIGDLVQRTSEAAIKPYIIQLTGPLIRVISGPAIAPQIKTGILSTLTVLLEEVPQLVRPFHPQLTRTFVKSASDPAAISVRSRAAAGLGALMKHQPRVDPLVTELLGGIRSAEKDVAPSIVQALAAVCSSAGKNIGPAARASIVELVEEASTEGRSENYNIAIGQVVAGLAKNDPEAIRSIAIDLLAAPTPPTTLVSIINHAVLEEAPDAFYELDVVEDIVKKVMSSIAVEQSGIARPARETRELMRTAEKWKADSSVQAALR